MIEAIRTDAARHAVTVTVRAACARPWASATFSGARHVLTLEATGEAQAIAAWIAALPEAELTLVHHIAADVAAAAAEDGAVRIEVLTVEAA